MILYVKRIFSIEITITSLSHFKSSCGLVGSLLVKKHRSLVSHEISPMPHTILSILIKSNISNQFKRKENQSETDWKVYRILYFIVFQVSTPNRLSHGNAESASTVTQFQWVMMYVVKSSVVSYRAYGVNHGLSAPEGNWFAANLIKSIINVLNSRSEHHKNKNRRLPINMTAYKEITF